MKTAPFDYLLAELESMLLSFDAWNFFLLALAFIALLAGICLIVFALNRRSDNLPPKRSVARPQGDIEHLCFISEREIHDIGSKIVEEEQRKLGERNKQNFPSFYRVT